MDRRSFLKFLTVGFAAAALPIPKDIESIVENFSDDQILEMSFRDPAKLAMSFNDLLKQYMPSELIREGLMKRDYLLSKIEPDNGL